MRRIISSAMVWLEIRIGLGHDEKNEGGPACERPNPFPFALVHGVVLLPQEPASIVVLHYVPVNKS